MSLPNFIIIGVAKAGTTSLYRYLDQHPQVFICPGKGSNFFGYEDARAWQWTEEGDPPLLRNFHVKSIEAYEDLFTGVRDEIAIGEVSPQYLRCPNAAKRIFKYIPRVKLIASLRNPADRAFSGFLMRARRGQPVKSLRKELTSGSTHVKEGFYYKRLKRYFDVFPRDQMKVYIFEEFKKNPVRIIVDMFDFLGVDKSFIPDTSFKHNHARVPKIRILNRLLYHPVLIRVMKSILPDSMHQMAKQVQLENTKPPPPFPTDVRASLLDLYRDDIYMLETLLKRDLSIWFTETGPTSPTTVNRNLYEHVSK